MRTSQFPVQKPFLFLFRLSASFQLAWSLILVLFHTLILYVLMPFAVVVLVLFGAKGVLGVARPLAYLSLRLFGFLGI
jgi:hypothetical protein